MTSKTSIRPLIFVMAFWLHGSGFALAQRNTLQNDPSISWIAEFTTDHSFDAGISDQQEIFQLTKFIGDPSTLDEANRTDWLVHRILTDAINYKTKAYADPGLTKILSETELDQMVVSIDTVTVFDAETFEQYVHIIKNEMDFSNIKKLRVNQLIYYNEKTKDFNTQVVSVAPLLTINETTEPQPLFWIKMDQAFPQDFNLHAPSITWGALGYSKEQPMTLNFLDEIKNTKMINFKSLINRQAIDLEKPVEDFRGFGSGNFLTRKEISSTHAGIDTITTFDPTTFEEEVKIVKIEVDFKKIQEYRLVQEWYYDAQRKQLMNRLKAIAPIQEVKDDKGNFKYSKPIYYIRYGKVKGVKKS